MNGIKLSKTQYYTYESRTKNLEWLHRTIELLHQNPERGRYEESGELFTNETIAAARKLLELIETAQPNSEDISNLYNLFKFYKCIRNSDWYHLCSYIENWHWVANIWDDFEGTLKLNLWNKAEYKLYSIVQPLIVEGKFVRQSSSIDSYGHVCLKIEPIIANSHIEIVWQIDDEEIIPLEWIPAIFEGIIDGIFDYFHQTNIALNSMRIIINDGSYHPVDSKEMDYRIAAKIAWRNALIKAEIIPINI
ncbi:elongation factor G domain IV [Nostoc sp. PCC 7107]|uniref:elongation factor G domain IV n=1 Tax=Nostoc sp. PCC 7107 TaxID=317936 RepID=UPI00029F3C27|nr:elongation factor G domain IV [Nostoc sp. PCC 7107]AFY43622.1 elongation factor G domain IV [Nostoc sp. PCC 7107]